MAKRVIDFDAMWGSDKLAACSEWAQAEYAWLYGLADACGSFEVTNLRVIWGRVAAIRRNLTIERLEQVFGEFHEKGLMFIWMHEGKRYAHWTGSDVPGRLPAPSWRMRLEKFAPPVPKERLAEYMARFARGKAAMGAAGFFTPTREMETAQSNLKFENSELKSGRAASASVGASVSFAGSKGAGAAGSKVGVEGTQGQDLDSGLDRNLNGNLERDRKSRVGESAWERGAIGNLIRGMGSESGTGVAFSSDEANLFSKNNPSDLESKFKPNSIPNSNSIADSISNSKAPYKIKSDSEHGSVAEACAGPEAEKNSESPEKLQSISNSAGRSAFDSQGECGARTASPSHGYSSEYSYARGKTAKEIATEKELRVGQGPVCGPKGVKPEILERVRQRDAAARAAAGKGR